MCFRVSLNFINFMFYATELACKPKARNDELVEKSEFQKNYKETFDEVSINLFEYLLL